jgi:shikimate dehydrogenase
MVPVDVAADKLPDLMKALQAEKRFLGGAVAMPYKSDIIPHLSGVVSPADGIRAVNCLFRGEAGELRGCNTDGEAAIASILAGRERPLRRALQIGLGGVGKAIAFYLARALGPEGKLLVSSRSEEEAAPVLQLLKHETQVEWIPFPPHPDAIPGGLQLVVNATSIGQENQVTDKGGSGVYLSCYSPLGEIPASPPRSRLLTKEALASVEANLLATLRAVSTLDSDCLLFDAVYQPLETPLLAVGKVSGRPIKNGLEMNLLQAAIAFRKVFPRFTEKEVLEAMKDEHA